MKAVARGLIPLGLVTVLLVCALSLWLGAPQAQVLQLFPLGVFAVLTLLERAVGRWCVTLANAPRDLLCNLVNLTVGGLAPALVAAALLNVPARGPLGALPFALALPLAVVVSDGAAYGVHRLFHAVPVLWRAHALHHAPQQLYTVVSAVDGPAFVFVIRATRALVVVALGFQADVLFVLAMFDTWQGLSAHCGVDTDNPWLSRVLVTPQTHRMHHSAEHTGNYSLLLTLWDRVLGTWVAPSAEVPLLGLQVRNAPGWPRLLLMRLEPGAPSRK